jgi:phage tail-like protein
MNDSQSNGPMDNDLDPFHVFRFQVDFTEEPIGGSPGSDVEICSGAFSECTGLEATMEAKVIKEGGRNYGPAQRAGQVSFGTVILKRGITSTRHLWQWFEFLNKSGHYAHRMTVKITLLDANQSPLIRWQLDRAMPTKLKMPDLNGKSNDIGIEELHLVHEGFSILS